MKCITPADDKEILEEIHIGCCDNHVASSRTLVEKAFRSGYYWPTAENSPPFLVVCRVAEAGLWRRNP
jgi:hypothetical protein